MTEDQMAFFGFVRLDEESIDGLDPSVQRQLLKGRKAYQCKTCKKITWVPMGYKESDFRQYDIHMHITTDYASSNTDPLTENSGSEVCP